MTIITITLTTKRLLTNTKVVVMKAHRNSMTTITEQLAMTIHMASSRARKDPVMHVGSMARGVTKTKEKDILIKGMVMMDITSKERATSETNFMPRERTRVQLKIIVALGNKNMRKPILLERANHLTKIMITKDNTNMAKIIKEAMEMINTLDRERT